MVIKDIKFDGEDALKMYYDGVIVWEKQSGGYATNGMLLYLDGINNTRNGHSESTTTWEDLSGNGFDFVKHNADPVWSEKSYVGKTDAQRNLKCEQAILSEVEAFTVECVFSVNVMKNYNWVFQSRPKHSVSGGEFQIFSDATKILFVYYNPTSTSLQLSKNTGEMITTSIVVTPNFILFYKNGELLKSVDNTQSVFNNGISYSAYNIGDAYPWNSNWPAGRLDGNIYSIRMYDRALTSEELLNNRNYDVSRFS